MHLRRGSVAVQPGQRVEAGQRLGLIGLSGDTEFPHLHFAVKRNGKPVDPFTGEGAPATCGVETGASLWDDKARRRPR